MLQLFFFQNFGAVAGACAKSFFGFPHWYEYLDVQQQTIGSTPSCVITNFTFPDSFLPVGLAIVDILLRVVGLVAVAFIMYGGFRYVTSQGEPDGIRSAQSTIFNALIGLVIALTATAIVSFIGHRLG